MTENKHYDAIGVILVPCRLPGKFKVQRIGVLNGQIVVIETLTDNRQVNWAHKRGLEEFGLLASDLARGKVCLNENPVPRLKIDG